MNRARFTRFGDGFIAWGALLTAQLAAGATTIYIYDASRFGSVRLTYVSSVQFTFAVPTVDTTEIANGGACTLDCNGHFGVTLPAALEPRTVEVAWTQLYQPFGARTVFDPTRTLVLQWMFASASPSTSGWTTSSSSSRHRRWTAGATSHRRLQSW